MQFKCDWGKEPTPGNTSTIKRVARNGKWVDVVTPYGNKRVPEPGKHLKVITGPLVVTLARGEG